MTEYTGILIVEDEFIVRKGIMETIDWKAINCKIIGEASDGKEAVKEIRRLKPDIVITDVCMKEMDGIELIKWIKDEEVDTKAIILSGYNDFEYAKSAMELGVRYYLLKPIENKKLIEAITSVQKEIDKEKKKQTPVTRQQIALRKLLEKDNADELLENMGLVVPTTSFVVANIKIESDYDDKGSETLKYTTELLESIDYFSGIDIHYNLSILVGEGNVAMIIFENNGKMAEKNILKNIRTHFALKTGKGLSIGVSCVGNSINDIHELYEQSCLALKESNNEPNNIIYYTDVRLTTRKTEIVFSDEDKSKILNAVNSNDIEKAKELFYEFFEKINSFDNIDIMSVKNSVIEIAVMIVKHAAKNFEEMHVVFGRKIQPSAEIIQLETISDIKIWVDEFLNKLKSHDEFIDVYKFSRLVRDVCIYIMQNYSNKLNVDILAKMFFVSEGHLMRAFKKETGMTVIEFVTEYRIYIAKNMLKDKNNKIYDVSRRVGYDDAKYFSKVFKKVTGEPPNQYNKLE